MESEGAGEGGRGGKEGERVTFVFFNEIEQACYGIRLRIVCGCGHAVHSIRMQTFECV